jgi:spectinomycin phosphotransferase
MRIELRACHWEIIHIMLLPDPTLDEAALLALVTDLYGVTPARLEFQPVGGDSWSYRAGWWWVSVRRDRQGHFPQAYETAYELREGGLDFVLAPEVGRNGAVVQWLGTRPVLVSRYLAGRPIFPDQATPGQANQLESMVAAIHEGHTTRDLPRETFEQPLAEQLRRAVALALAGAETSGPYGEPVTRLVRHNSDRLTSLEEEMRACQAACRLQTPRFVLTHGEPNRGNLFLTADGRLLLMDWGDLAWGPPERDLVMRPDVGLPRTGDETLLRFYELRWVLGEIAEYVERFVEPHAGDAEDHAMWQELLLYLPLDGNTPI